MSQEEPRPEPSAECFIYSHPHGHPGLCLVCQDTRGMGILNNVDNSEPKLPPLRKKKKVYVHTDGALSLSHFVFPSHTLCTTLLSRCLRLCPLPVICHL